MKKRAFQLPLLFLNLGWTRLLIVVYLSWIAIVGARLLCELDGQTADMFLTRKTESPASFSDSDLDQLENELRKNLKAFAQQKVESQEVDESQNPYMQSAKQYRQYKQAELAKSLDLFSVAPLSNAAIVSLANDLSISEQLVRDSETDARRYVQLRDLKRMMVESPVLKAQFLGVKPMIFSINFTAIFLALFGLPTVIYMLGILVFWIKQGFRTQV